MPAPITHLVVAELAFDNFLGYKNRREFYLGNCFPDIRYLGKIRREATHFSGITLGEIKAEDSFLAGVKFHSWVDGLRMRFVSNYSNFNYWKEILSASGFLSSNLLPTELRNIDRCLKLLEDAFFYQKKDNWEEVIGFLKSDLLEEELDFGLSREVIERWRNVLFNYFSQKPDKITRSKFLVALGFTQDQIDWAEDVIAFLKDRKELRKFINDFWRFWKEQLNL